MNNNDQRDAAWMEFAHKEGFAATDAVSNFAFEGGWVARGAQGEPSDAQKLERAMARIEQLSDGLGIPYVYETGNISDKPIRDVFGSEPSDALVLAALNESFQVEAKLEDWPEFRVESMRAALRRAKEIE